MAINYTSGPGGASLSTDVGQGLGLPAMPGFDPAFFQAMAMRKAQQQADDRAHRAKLESEAAQRQNEQDAMEREKFKIGIQDHDDAKRQAQMDAMSAGSHPDEVHWYKNFGIGKGGDFGGPVEVAPGTFGAYRASLPGSVPGASEAAAKRGLTPGLAGQQIGGTNQLLGGISGTEDDEDDRLRKQKAVGGDRMTLGQAGIGLGYQHIRGYKDE